MQRDIINMIGWSERPAEIANELRAAIVNGLAQGSGKGVCVWTGREGDIQPTPSTGALLRVDWAVSDRSYMDWYPTVEQARAALATLAAQYDRVAYNDYLDLTAPGGVDSSARVIVQKG